MTHSRLSNSIKPLSDKVGMASRLVGPLDFTLMVMLIPKVDPERRQLEITTSRWPLSFLTTYSRAGTQDGPWKASVRGHDLKVAFKYSYHLWPCWYPSWTLKGISWGSRPQDSLQVFLPLVVMPVPNLDPKSYQLGVMTPRWPSSLLTTFWPCRYPSWTL